MTTIVYDGRFLVSDTKITATRVDSLPEHCPHCYKNLEVTCGEYNKVTLLNGRKIFDVPVSVVASAGETSVAQVVRSAVRDSENIGAFMSDLFSNLASSVTDSQHLFGSVKGVFAFAAGTFQFFEADLDRKNPQSNVSIGSGCESAMTLLALGYSSVTAAVFAAIRDSATGYDISIFDLSTEVPQQTRLSAIIHDYDSNVEIHPNTKLENWFRNIGALPAPEMKKKLSHFENWVNRKLIPMFDAGAFRE